MGETDFKEMLWRQWWSKERFGGQGITDGGGVIEDPAWCTSQRCCTVNFQAKQCSGWAFIGACGEVYWWQGRQEEFVERLPTACSFLVGQVGHCQYLLAVCVWGHSTNSNSVHLWEIAWWADTSTLGMWSKVLCLAVPWACEVKCYVWQW